MIDINKITITELRAVAERYPTEPFTSFVIVPMNRTHDSGFGCMKFVLLRDNEIVGCVGGFSDVVHLNGIGGYGRNWIEGFYSQSATKPIGWSMDLLRKSGCVRVFCGRELTTDEWVCSDFEVFVSEREKP